MMADWKYVMFEANGQLLPIIFPGELVHIDVARSMASTVREHVVRAKPGNWSSKIMSAGFVSGLAVTSVHGRSQSMEEADGTVWSSGAVSREEDAAIMNMMPYDSGRAALDSKFEQMMLVRMAELLLNRAREL